MNKVPLLSIIVPVYKVEDYLDVCVKSIIDQNFTNFELILVDDGSPDRSPEICDRWAGEDNRIRVIHKRNGGLSDARNYGVDVARGDYIWFVDSDDWIAEGALMTIAKGCENYPDAEAIAIQLIENRDGIETFHGFFDEWPSRDMLIRNIDFVKRFTSVLPSVRYIVKRSIFTIHKLRFIVGVLHEDMPFCHMLMYYTKNIAILPRVAYFYRIRRGSITTTPNIMSSYSLVKSHKEIKRFMNSITPNDDKCWLLGLSYDIFYEMFLRIRPFIGQKEYREFMSDHGKYVRDEFWKLRKMLGWKRRLLIYIFMISPKLYSVIIFKKRYCK